MIRVLLVFILLIGGRIISNAQESLSFHHINTKGYSVQSIYRDVHGIVWLGTSAGLVSLPQLESSRPERYVRRYEEMNTSITLVTGDNKGNLWLKTNYSDMLFYNPQTDEMAVATGQYFEAWGVNIRKDFSVSAYKDCITLIWKENYLLVQDSITRQVSRIDMQPTECAIKTVKRRGDNIVVLTNESLCYISISEKRLMRTIPLPKEQKGISSANKIVIDHDLNTWTLYYNNIRKYNYDADRWETPVEFPAFITTFEIGDKNQLWVATIHPGLYICDADGQVVRHLQHSPWTEGSLQSGQVDIIYYEESCKTMWIAYQKGGMSVCFNHSDGFIEANIPNSAGQEAETDVLTFASSNDGNLLWTGTERRGVFAYDYSKNSWENVISGGSATALMTAADGSLWAGLYLQGLVRVGYGTYFKGMSPYAICENEQGVLYVALLGSGVWQLNPSTGEISDTHIPVKYIYDLKYHRQHLYAATTDGLYCMDSSKSWKKLKDCRLRSIVIDVHNHLWLLGNKGNEGLSITDLEGQTVESIDDLKHAQLKSIVADKDSNIWITTANELLMLKYDSLGKLMCHTFNINGFDRQTYYNHHAILVDRHGTLWLGTSRGYKKIDLSKLTSQTRIEPEPCPLVIGAISINGNLLSPGVEVGGTTILQSDVVFVRKLCLRSDENNIVLDCMPIHAEKGTGNTFYCQVQGLSDTWFPIKNGSIALSNLPSGDYQLFTKTSQTPPCRLLTIHIARPLWLSWWACLCYVIMTGVLVWLFLKKRAYARRICEVEQRQQQESQFNEMKLRFFTNISHDLRTPLSLIIGPAEELLKDEKLKMNSALNMIYRNAQHLLMLVNQILDFRRLEFGSKKLQLSYGDIVSLVEDVCDSFRLKARKENVNLIFRSDAECIETMFDQDKVTKIMMNLLSNAFKFTKIGGFVTVKVSISNGQIYISVIDTGIGIPASEKPYIFDRFYQVSGQDTMGVGSGIGLHIVREYVRLHGGDITVSDGVDGKGTQFLFNIPLRKLDSKEIAIRGEEVLLDGNDYVSEEENTSHNTTLLIVEDNEDMRNYLNQNLAKKYDVIAVVNGHQALEILRSHDVDVVVSDVMMPEIDGLELCRRIKTDIETSHIPIILLTAKAMTDDELLGLEAGADDYITKPFNMDILFQRIHNILERSRQRHERFVSDIDISPSEITVSSLDEQFIAKAISVVEAHIGDPELSVEQIASEMTVHRSQLYKKLQHLTGKRPIQFIRLIRLKRAKQLLEQSGLYVSEVAYQVGYNSPRIFSRHFREEFGVNPKEYIKAEGKKQD